MWNEQIDRMRLFRCAGMTVIRMRFLYSVAVNKSQICCKLTITLVFYLYEENSKSSLQSSAVEQVLDILLDILSWEIAEVVSPCLPHGL